MSYHHIEDELLPLFGYLAGFINLASAFDLCGRVAATFGFSFACTLFLACVSFGSGRFFVRVLAVVFLVSRRAGSFNFPRQGHFDLKLEVFLVDQGVLGGDFLAVLLLRREHDVVVVLHLTEAGEHRHADIAVALDAVNREKLGHSVVNRS
jgi:hypothetical protein